MDQKKRIIMRNKKLMIIQKRINYQIKRQINQDKEQNKKWKKCKVKCNKDYKMQKDRSKSMEMNYKNLMNLQEIKYKEQRLIIKRN